MKLQRSTVGLVATALILGGAVWILQATQTGDRPTASSPQTEASPVFDFQEADVVGLHIETQSQAVTFAKDNQGTWQMTEPAERPAEAAAIAFLLSRLTTDGLLQTTTIDAAAQADFGLDVPFTTVDITLADGTTHRLILGDADFSGSNAYALIDPAPFPVPDDAGEMTVAVVSDDIVNGTNRPLEEWQAQADTADPEGEDATNAADDPVTSTPLTPPTKQPDTADPDAAESEEGNAETTDSPGQ